MMPSKPRNEEIPVSTGRHAAPEPRPEPDGAPALRLAGVDAAGPIALLHADSWRRHYRGAYADSYLDGDLVADRRAVWAARLADPGDSRTVLAEDGNRLV